MESKRVWMRIGVSNPRLNTPGEDRHWRLFVGPSLEEIPLRGIKTSGIATDANLRTKSNSKRDPDRHLAAWFSMFGDVRIDHDIAYVELLEPSEAELHEDSALDPEGTLSLHQ